MIWSSGASGGGRSTVALDKAGDAGRHTVIRRPLINWTSCLFSATKSKQRGSLGNVLYSLPGNGKKRDCAHQNLEPSKWEWNVKSDDPDDMSTLKQV